MSGPLLDREGAMTKKSLTQSDFGPTGSARVSPLAPHYRVRRPLSATVPLSGLCACAVGEKL